MQISDLFVQFGRNGKDNMQSAGTTLTPSTGKELAETIKQLPVGNIFEATINEIKDGEVTLGLSNGETLLARLQADIQLQVGDSMFFQVKANNGIQIELKPYTDESGGNPTLLKALFAAGLTATPKNLTMVDAMMREQLPIDKSSLLNMAKNVGANERIPISTVVEMNKYGIPVTPEHMAAFENFKTDQNMLARDLNQLISTLPEKAGDNALPIKEAVAFQQQLISFVDGSEAQTQKNDVSQQTAAPQPATASQAENVPQLENSVTQQQRTVQPENNRTQPQSTVQPENNVTQPQSTVQPENSAPQPADAPQAERASQQPTDTPQQAVNTRQAENTPQADGTGKEPLVRELLNETQQKELSEILSKLGMEQESGAFTGKELLKAVKELLSDSGVSHREQVRELFSNKGYQQILRSALESEWLMQPKNFTDSEKVGDFFERMAKQMNQLQQQAQSAGSTMAQTAQSAADIQNNIQFMHVLNQTYTYVQIPLKLANQNAQGNLYVYTNKKNLKEKEGELSAFLHLDLEHLGATDVSVRLKGKNVTTRFYLSDEDAFTLVKAHTPQLEKILEEMGYRCKTEVEQDMPQENGTENFLNQDRPAGAILHRYSFDMRA